MTEGEHESAYQVIKRLTETYYGYIRLTDDLEIGESLSSFGTTKRPKTKTIIIPENPELDPVDLFELVDKYSDLDYEELWKTCRKHGMIVPSEHYCRISILHGLCFAAEKTIDYFIKLVSKPKYAYKTLGTKNIDEVWDYVRDQCDKIHDPIEDIVMIWEDIMIQIEELITMTIPVRQEQPFIWSMIVNLRYCRRFFEYTYSIMGPKEDSLVVTFESLNPYCDYFDFVSETSVPDLPEGGPVVGTEISELSGSWSMLELDQYIFALFKLWTEIPYHHFCLCEILDNFMARISKFHIFYLSEVDKRECPEYVTLVPIEDVYKLDTLDGLNPDEVDIDKIIKRKLEQYTRDGLKEFDVYKEVPGTDREDRSLIPDIEIFKQNSKKFLATIKKSTITSTPGIEWIVPARSRPTSFKKFAFVDEEEEDEFSSEEDELEEDVYVSNDHFMEILSQRIKPLLMETKRYAYIVKKNDVPNVPFDPEFLEYMRLWSASVVACEREKVKVINSYYKTIYMDLLLRPGEAKIFRMNHKNVQNNAFNILNKIRPEDKKRYQDIYGDFPEKKLLSLPSSLDFFTQGFRLCHELYIYSCIRCYLLEKSARIEGNAEGLVLDNYFMFRHKWDSLQVELIRGNMHEFPVVVNFGGSWLLCVPTVAGGKYEDASFVLYHSLIQAVKGFAEASNRLIEIGFIKDDIFAQCNYILYEIVTRKF